MIYLNSIPGTLRGPWTAQGMVPKRRDSKPENQKEKNKKQKTLHWLDL